MPLFPSIKVLNTQPLRFTDEALAAMHQIASIHDVDTDRQFLLDHIHEYDGLFIALRHVFDKELLSRAERLKFIVTPTTGLNHMDLDMVREKGIKILSLKGETTFLENVTATAELTWGLLLALYRKIPAAHGDVLSGGWRRDSYHGRELKNKTLGVIGCGRLGKMVCKMGQTFRMKVLAFDKEENILAPGVDFVPLERLLAESDVISLHLPLEEETKNFIDASKIARMKKDAVFINTSRGEIVDEAALLAALEGGLLAGAATDVLARETSADPLWLKNDPLRAYAESHENLIITPHIGGATVDSVIDTNMFMIKKMESYLRQVAGAA